VAAAAAVVVVVVVVVVVGLLEATGSSSNSSFSNCFIGVSSRFGILVSVSSVFTALGVTLLNEVTH
jgi:hypothetical protein